MIGSPGGSYKLEPIGTIAQQLRELTARAAQRGKKEECLAVLREIAQRLSTNPVPWGDCICTYKAVRLEEYHRLYKMLSVRYAVDQANKIVYLKECRPVLNHPLAGP